MNQKQDYQTLGVIRKNILLVRCLAEDIMRKYHKIPYRPSVVKYIARKIDSKRHYTPDDLEQKINYTVK
jgi:hypothetical protein